MAQGIAKYQPEQERTPMALSIADQALFANNTANSDIIPAAYRGKPANIIVAVGLGTSMGLTPAESLYRIDVIQGTPCASAELVAAQVRKAGHKLRLTKDEAAQSVTCTIVRCDDPDYPVSVTRDRAWAQAMGLLNKDNYKKQPMTMLTWRAITACAREACSEALYGVAYTPDEMTDMRPQQPVPAQDVLQQQAQAAPAQAQPAQQQPAQPTAQKLNPQQAAELMELCSEASQACGMGIDEMKRAVWTSCRWDGAEPWDLYMRRARQAASDVCAARLGLGEDYDEEPAYEC